MLGANSKAPVVHWQAVSMEENNVQEDAIQKKKNPPDPTSVVVQDLSGSTDPTHPLVKQWLLKRAMDLFFNRYTVRFFACGPLRWSSDTLYYFDVQTHPHVRGHVALTIDDAPCRSSSSSRVSQVVELLDRYGARATFMVIGSFIPGHEDDMIDLLRRGHEIGNHGMMDERMDRDTPDDFLQAVDECSNRIRTLQKQAGVPEGVKWFRAPHGKYTTQMQRDLSKRNLQNVMCDTYGCCPIVQDSEYIGRSLARNAQDGSIVLLHMPEGGFRDHCLSALTRLLEGLHRRGLKVVTVSEMERLANKKR
jgi:peptidoglycan/xylan/chitin deacetylase (PgdA/CDA1 family)